MYDVVVIGAGVCGGMIARELCRYGLKVCIVEKDSDVAMGASKANSAIIHAGFDAKEGSLKARLNVKGSQMMRQVARELGVKYINNGSLVIGFDESDRATLEILLARGKRNGVKNMRIIEKEELLKLEPNLSDNVICALYAPTGAIICPYELTIAAVGNAMDNGAVLMLDYEVTGIEKKDGFFVIKGNCGEIETKNVINAAGIYSDKIAGFVGDNSFSVHPRRGEYILLDKECGKTVRHTVFRTPTKMGKGILISPTVDGNLIVGPTSKDIADKEDKDTTREGLALVMKEAKENVPSVALNKAVTSFCGIRAVGNSGDFIINSPIKGFVNVAGIESPGLSASPAIAEYVADILREQGVALEKKQDFNPIRKSMHKFREADIDEKNKMIEKNSAYGKIICRCEGVTEGEILDALYENPAARDLDGVKRRTRAQMGRCQGGFCMPYVVELIARETGIPYEKVTKSSGKSYVNVSQTKEVK